MLFWYISIFKTYLNTYLFLYILYLCPHRWCRLLLLFPSTPTHIHYHIHIYYTCPHIVPKYPFSAFLSLTPSPILLYYPSSWPYRRRFFFQHVQTAPIHSLSFSRLHPLHLNFLLFIRSSFSPNLSCHTSILAFSSIFLFSYTTFKSFFKLIHLLDFLVSVFFLLNNII